MESFTLRKSFQISTGDDTPTTLGTLDFSDSRWIYVRVEICAEGKATVQAFTEWRTIYECKNGTLSKSGVKQKIVTGTPGTSSTAMILSGNTLTIQVTGVAAENVVWCAFIQGQEQIPTQFAQ